ncbi:MAG: YqaA family protein [Prevotella sp.]|nr:DedA family protein [Prevotella sp.]MDY4217378.1 YqaA family protein [Prevotella sp.]
MDFFDQFLLSYGYWGMFISAFLAGSILPFSSEAVMVGLLAGGLQPVPLLIYSSVGNILGSVLNYAMGRLGKLEWIEKYLHVSRQSLDKAQRFMGGHGAWMGFFAIVPVIGDAITISLGLMRANMLISFLSVSISKTIRYALILWGTDWLFF